MPKLFGITLNDKILRYVIHIWLHCWKRIMNRRVTCPTSAQLPYHVVSHKIDNNILTIKLPKDRHPIEHPVQAVDRQIDEPIDVNCSDKYGKVLLQ